MNNKQNKYSKSFRTRLFGFLQELGKTFMFPVSLLAFLGILLGLGSAFTSQSMIDSLPWLANENLQVFFSALSTIGGFAFTYLPVLFSIAIPAGLAKRNQWVAAYSGFVAFMLMNMGISFMLDLQGNLASPELMRQVGQVSILGIQTIEMGILGGLISGLTVYKLHDKFQDIVLPDAFSFFGGIRFIPIISSLVMFIIGLILPYIWPIFGMLITQLGNLIQKAGIFGPFLYGIGVLALKPFGMHHILLAMIRFTEAGGTQMVNGERISGALNIFYAQLNAGLPISPQATAFLSQGFMPTFMFGLPAVALAIYVTAKDENKKTIKGLLISGVLVSFVTGISEPIEFLFLFVAPALYIFHSIMSGLALMIMSLVGVVIGNTDGGVIDWIIFGIMQGKYTKWYLLIPIGIIWFLIYFYVFKSYIIKNDIKTPGREEKINVEDDEIKVFTKGNGLYDPEIILEALGGKNNIISIDNCVTRLRLQIKDMAVIDEHTIRKAGALGVVKLDNQNIQIIIGAQVQSVKTGIEALL